MNRPSFIPDMEIERVTVIHDGPEADAILKRSFSRWQAALQHAKSLKSLPERCFKLEGVLSRIPSLPESLPRARYIEGYSTWDNLEDSSATSCKLRTKTEKTRPIYLRVEYHIICTISSSPNFQTWEETENNGLLLLVLGWAYVFAVNLAERTRLKVEYSHRPSLGKASKPTKLKLKYASLKERAWWTALVSNGVGWSLSDCRITPWTLFADNVGIEIEGNIDVNRQRPPTSQEAACYLSRFCDAYGLGTQLAAAFAVAVTIPLHGQEQTAWHRREKEPVTIGLPRPLFKTTTAVSTKIGGECPDEFSSIGYYMTLSLDTTAIGPCLWSVFYEQDIPCNFAGAWIGPITDVIETIVEADDMELFAKLFSFSKAAPLWLGISICGRDTWPVTTLAPTLAYGMRGLHSFLSIDGPAWTGTSGSFMDIHRPRPLVRNGMISRTDIWRLRHDCYAEYTESDFLSLPFDIWPPFGEMSLKDVEFGIHDHLECSHDWRYKHWTWLPSKTTDAGFRRGKEKERKLKAFFSCPKKIFRLFKTLRSLFGV
ncbi:hypothetical protein PT974_08089 [Cladobotryum mycophilum]|uniref:Uncharacterized protein n=1 Tax=Cladobotryum mycophilum TaxID=491253 RepID=A0ABR0SCB6_9HYPO